MAHAESAAAAKTRFDADGFGSPSFKGDVVIVTGGTTGIGAACCAHLAKAGGVVYNIDFKAPAADVPGVTHLQCDVSDVAQVKRAVGAVIKAHGRIDTLVSNAGVWHGGDFEKITERDFDKVVGVNLKGTFFGIQAAVPAMLENGGSIVIIGSDQSLIGKPEQHLYGCTKGAIAQLSKSLAAHYAPKGVRVNCVCPGTIDTPLMHGAVQDFVKQKGANAQELYTWLETAQPLPRLGRPEEVAALVACVAKIPFCVGSMISVDGGYTAQ
jgi:NAD(P)-dependent dehydrogenase (short-subunit alcohol dehydrogenase family)